MGKERLDVVYSGMVMWQDIQPQQSSSSGGIPQQQHRECPARLVLTKDQLTIQVHISNAALIPSTTAISQADSQLELALRTVNVPKAKEGLGFSIKGGAEGGQSIPVVISKVLQNMSAARTGQVFVGDVIVEVDGTPTDGKTHDEVVQLLKGSSGDHVTLTLRRDSQIGAMLHRPGTGSGEFIPGMFDAGGIVKSAMKSQTELGEKPSQQDDDLTSRTWNIVSKVGLTMAMISRYLWGTDKIRNNAFEVRAVDGQSSGVIRCEDKKALEQWITQIETYIGNLNRKSIRSTNKSLHASEKISYIGWSEERMPDGYFDDPKVKWERRFMVLKGPYLCLFESPPLTPEELDKCISLYKVYETALKTAIKPIDRRDAVFCVDTPHDAVHFLSMHSREQLQRFECAYYNCLYKAVNGLQARTFACSINERPAGLVLDVHKGFSCYDIPTKRYIWQYGFGQLESSSDDGKMRLQFVFKNPASSKGMDTRDIECDNVLTLVFTLHAFYITKIMGVDPEFLRNLPLA